MSTSVAKRSFLDKFRTEKAANIHQMNFEDVTKQLHDEGALVDAAESGEGFTVISRENKKMLIGLPFVIVDWKVNQSSTFKTSDGKPSEFVSVKIITKDNRKFIFNDGGAGIINQLSSSRPDKAILCRHGLICSEYDRGDGMGRGQTYYLDTTV